MLIFQKKITSIRGITHHFFNQFNLNKSTHTCPLYVQHTEMRDRASPKIKTSHNLNESKVKQKKQECRC